MKIYTKTGDSGETSLYGGERLSKASLRIQLIGDLDELQAALGVSLSYLDETSQDVIDLLVNIQKQLYILSAQVARSSTISSKVPQNKTPSVDKKMILGLEQEIDSFEKELPELKYFILLGGSKPGSQLHLSRTVCRRVERGVVALHLQEELDPLVLEYLNRLSDLLFVLARVVNHQLNCQEIPLINI